MVGCVCPLSHSRRWEITRRTVGGMRLKAYHVHQWVGTAQYVFHDKIVVHVCVWSLRAFSRQWLCDTLNLQVNRMIWKKQLRTFPSSSFLLRFFLGLILWYVDVRGMLWVIDLATNV